ncbi:MAG TPA: peptidase M48, partial [Hyphomicrobium sp.]|nr:peptidase M48 [Hyphomicrobium sp.]
MPSNPSTPITNETFFARLSDGKSASARDTSVRLGLSGIEVAMLSPGQFATWPYGTLKSAEPVRTHAIDVLLASSAHPGASLFVPNPQFARDLRKMAPHLTAGAERWRNARPWVFGAAAAVGLIAAVYAAGWSPIKS